MVSSTGAQTGDSCNLSIGQATCGERQACVYFTDAGMSGTCRAFCDPADPNRGCIDGFACTQLTVGNSSATESVCLPVSANEDASFAVDGGSTDDGRLWGDVGIVQPDAMYDSIQPKQ